MGQEALRWTRCRTNHGEGTVELGWESVRDARGYEVQLHDRPIAALPRGATSFEHRPRVTSGRTALLRYRVIAQDSELLPATCRAALSPGTVLFADDFEDHSTDVDLILTGYFVTTVGDAVERADWTLLNPGERPNPPSFDGSPTFGQFLISDSRQGPELNPPFNNGISYDLWGPIIDASDVESLWLHFHTSVQLNNRNGAVFEVDVSSDGGRTWSTVLDRLSPDRVFEPRPSLQNADGFFGRMSIDLSSAAGETDATFRLRHLEPSKDYWIAIDDIVVDDVPPSTGGSRVLLPRETFESGVPANWTVRGVAGEDASWTTNDPCERSIEFNGGRLPVHEGRGVHRLEPPFAIVDSSCAPEAKLDQWLVTPNVDASAFRHVFLHFRSEHLVGAEEGEVLVSLDGGVTFLEEPVFDYESGALAEPGQDPFFAERVIEVPRAAGQFEVAFAFHFRGTDAWWWAVDDVAVTAEVGVPGAGVLPGDSNGDGSLDLSDGIEVLVSLFLDFERPQLCPGGFDSEANRSLHDFDGDGIVDVSDAIRVFSWLFGGGPEHVLGVRCREIVGCPELCVP